MIDEKVFRRIKKIFQDYWYLNPEELKEKILKILKKCSLATEIRKVVVVGETKNLTLYVFQENSVIIFTPFQRIKENLILKKNSLLREFLNRNIAVLPRSKELEERLTLPKVVLINPYIYTKYPIPRLSLNVSMIASYLRKYQKAHVWILDTQLGLKVKDIEREVLRIRPDIIGVSIPHGQTPLAIKILDKIYQLKRRKVWSGIVIIGNFIAASFPDYFLEKYPEIIIARGEGENTMLDLVDFVKGKKKLDNVSGIITKYKDRKIITPLKPVNMDNLPPPAFDTVKKLAELKGALTHEWSRGCFWECSFCPRHHKPKRFKSMSPEIIISHLKYFNIIMNKFHQLSRHLYLADEETVGGIDENETKRLIRIAEDIIKNNIRINFDAYTRIDQVYNPKMNEDWHIHRMKMWYFLKKAGLKRVFVGVESGSRTQLIRYGKGITPEQSIMAIRLLSSMGVEFRLGFIMFDPLMNLKELIENVIFLERGDILMKTLNYDPCEFGKLFSNIHKEKFIRENKLGKPLYTRVSYMLAQLEVLVGCRYLKLLKIAEKRYNKKLIIGIPDLTIGKIKVKYLDPQIGLLARFSQEWIDRNFELMYAIKGLRKTAKSNEKNSLFNLMEIYRKLSLDLIKVMTLIIVRSEKNPWVPPGILKKYDVLDEFHYLLGVKSIKNSLRKCLKLFLYIMENEIVNPAFKLLKSKKISDTKDNRLKKAILKWKNYNSISRIIAE